MRFLATFLIVLVFWLLLSGHYSPVLLTFAVVYSLVTAYFTHDLFISEMSGTGVKRMFKLLGYLPWLIWQIVVANLQVAYFVLHPSMPIDPSMVEVDTDLKTDMGKTVLGNSITLTPGTVTVDITGSKVLVHALTGIHAAGITNKDIEKKVLGIEGAADV